MSPTASEQPASAEQEAKHGRVRALLDATGAEALLLSRASSFAWGTGGISSVVNTASDSGEGMLLYTREAKLLLANAIEAPAFRDETPAAERGWQVVEHPWDSSDDPVAAHCTGGILADMGWHGRTDVSDLVAAMRAALGPDEQARMRSLGPTCARAVEGALHAVRRGASEWELAADVARRALEQGIEPIVVLVAADERLQRVRHPRPTGRAIDRHAMAVLCGRRNGLVCSVSRLVHFGPPSRELLRNHAAAAGVDAALLASTRPGVTLGSAFDTAIAAYREAGFDGEWHRHHQGGIAGYEPREFVAMRGSDVELAAGMACAWNPSAPGAKSEDTVLVGEGSAEVVTDSGEWPRTAVEGVDAPPRPDLLVRMA